MDRDPTATPATAGVAAGRAAQAAFRMVKIGVDGTVTDLGTLSCSHAEPIVELTCRVKRWWHRLTHGGSDFGFACVWRDPSKGG